MYFSARTQMLSKYSLNRTLEIFKDLGFDGVEISMLNRDFSFRPELHEDYVIDYNMDLINKLELKVSALSYHGDINDEVRFDNIQKTIKKVKSYGTNILIISGSTRKDFDKNEWEQMIRKTRLLVKIAEEQGVIIAVEFEPGFVIGNTNDLLALFDEISSDNIAANLDLGHVFLCDKEPFSSIEKLNKKIVHVHIENMFRGVHNHQLPDKGDMDLKAYIDQLKSISFQGGVALDVYSYDYELIAKGALESLKKLY